MINTIKNCSISWIYNTTIIIAAKSTLNTCGTYFALKLHDSKRYVLDDVKCKIERDKLYMYLMIWSA